MRFGAKLLNSGAQTERIRPDEAAALAEQAGFDSVWVADHIVMTRTITSPYPFSPDERPPWDPEDPWYDALITLAVAAAVTERVEIGVAVLIAPLRHPVVLAKQLASLDALGGGRLALGVGAGWLAEEYEALGVPFEQRGGRLDEWIDLIRDCWTGKPGPRSSQYYRMPDGLLTYPKPDQPIPILIGGMSSAALRRVGRRGDGWIAFQNAGHIEPEVLRAGVEEIATEARSRGRAAPRRVVVRIPGPVEDIATRIRHLENAGVTDLIVDVDWLAESGPHRILETLRGSRS